MNKSKLILVSNHLEKICKGIEKTSELVVGTLGPEGRAVLIDNSYDGITPTKDGYAVANEVTLDDPTEQMGAALLKKVCKHVADKAGDGTTSAAAMFNYIVENGYKRIELGYSSRALAEGISYAANKAIDFLTRQSESIDINDKKRIAEIATISTNGDENLGNLVSDIVSKVGADGVINISDSKSMNTHYTSVDGMKIKQGFASPHFKTQKDKEICEMTDAYVFVYSGNISSLQKLSKMSSILEGVAGNPLLILSETDEAVLSALIINNLRGATKICVSKLPGFGDNKNKTAEDIAAFVGAKFIDESKGMDIAKCTMNDLGKVKKVVADTNHTILIDGDGSKKDIDYRCQMIRDEIAELGDVSSSEYQRNILNERLGNLKGTAAVVYVGSINEEAQKELKYRVEDAVQAAKAAVKNGIIPGGSSSLVRASKYLESVMDEIRHSEKLSYSNLRYSYIMNGIKDSTASDLDNTGKRLPCSEEFIDGVKIMTEALCSPITHMLSNAGINQESQIIIQKIKDSDSNSIGFDVRNNQMVDMKAVGILDPLSSPVEALKIIAQMSHTVLRSHASIADKKEEKSDQSNAMPPMY